MHSTSHGADQPFDTTPERLHADEVAELSCLKPFDLFHNDAKELAAFRVADGRLLDGLAHYRLVTGVSDLRLTLDGYIEELVKSRGFMFWQRARLWPNGSDMKELTHFLPQIFGNGSSTP